MLSAPVVISPGVEYTVSYLAPDGHDSHTSQAFVTPGSGPTVHWTPAVMDLYLTHNLALARTRPARSTCSRSPATSTTRSSGSILYGLPRADQAGDYDVWALAADGSAEPEVFIEHAWSPAVVLVG